MPRGVNNPFKEKKSRWLQYMGGIVLVALGFFAYSTLQQSDNDAGVHDHTANKQSSLRMVEEAILARVKKQHAAKAVVKHEEPEEEEEEDEDEDFPEVDLSDYAEWISNYYKSRKWKRVKSSYTKQMDRSMLLESLTLGCHNIANNMREEGNFNYQYDFVTGEMDNSDSQVRQAGALWGLSLCYQYDQKKTYKNAFKKGIAFFLKHSIEGPEPDMLLVRYPGEDVSNSGTNALVGLAIIEYLRTVKDNDLDVDDAYKSALEGKLRSYINFLKWMQKSNKQFSDGYDLKESVKRKHASPYFDGETMLCLAKAAKYLDGYSDLIPLIEDTSMTLAKKYTVDSWRDDTHDSDQTKGFYQWSSMFLAEYHDARWKDYEIMGDYVVALTHWILHTHEVLTRQKNTGYAFEGIISAYNVIKSRETDSPRVLADIEYSIDAGLHKLTSWQVGGPLAKENVFLQQHPTDDKMAIGGVMNDQKLAPLRIDTTQHQMHAVIMALESVYTS